MAVKYRLTITDQDMQQLHANKEAGQPTMLFLEPINPEEGLKEIQIEVAQGERQVEPTVEEPTVEPAAEPAAEPTVEDDIKPEEMTPGFTGESRVSSLDSFFRINEKKEEEEEEKEEDTDDKKDDDSDDKGSNPEEKDASDKPKFGSPEWRAMYPPGKKGKGKKKKKTGKVDEQSSAIKITKTGSTPNKGVVKTTTVKGKPEDSPIKIKKKKKKPSLFDDNATEVNAKPGPIHVPSKK